MLEKFIEPGFIKSFLMILLVGYALIFVAPHFYPHQSAPVQVRTPEDEKTILDATYKIGYLQAQIQIKDSLISDLENGNKNIIKSGIQKKSVYNSLPPDKQTEEWNKQFNKIFK